MSLMAYLFCLPQKLQRSMDFQSSVLASFCLLCLVLSPFPLAHGQHFNISAMFIFGDSAVDVGNNNDLPTLIKANFPPYGRDFNNNTPTGRFSNGRLATDFLADYLSFPFYQKAYLSKPDNATNLLIGANFASAASGYYDPTADFFMSTSLSKQLELYVEYQQRLIEIVGEANATSIFSRGIYIISAGTSDFIQNYYINPVLNTAYTPDQFTNILIRNYEKFIQELYGFGARRIAVTSLPPVGCLPAAITLFGLANNECVTRLNRDALAFNQRLASISQTLQNRLTNLKLVVFDIYHPLYDIITNPAEHGFSEARRGCCGTGLVEVSILCNPLAVGTCQNATEYVFWDSFHPSEAANQIIFNNIVADGISLVT